MNIAYLLLARYRAIAEKNKYIILALSSDAESFSQGKARFLEFVLLPMTSDVEIGMGLDEAVLKPLPLFFMYGEADGANLSEGKADILLLPLVKINADETIESEGAGIARPLPVNPLTDGKIELTTDTLVLAIHLCKLLRLNEVRTIIESDAAGVAYAFKLIKLDGMTESHSDGDAIVHSYKILSPPTEEIELPSFITSAEAIAAKVIRMFVDVEDYSSASALGRALPVLLMGGFDEAESEAKAISNAFRAVHNTANAYNESAGALLLNIFEPVLKSGVAFNDLAALAEVNMVTAALCEATAQNNSKALAGVKLWYLPFQDGSNLYIRQVTSATQTGTNLGVK